MPMQKLQLAAPPDDGGNSGIRADAVQGLQRHATDTRSSQVIGEEPRHDHHTNRGLMWFHAWIAALVLALLGLAYLQPG